nr:ATP-binding cassette domain-containing protein [Arcanobacterium phocisimile]
MLDGLSFTVPRGSIVSLVGPNGSGKSTLLRILLNLEKATSGEAIIGGKPYAEFSKDSEVGVSLDTMIPHPSRRAIDQLCWIAAAKGIDKQSCVEKLEYVGLAGAERRRIKAYSLGMKQRLRIASALLGDPDVLVLDEPVNGLDPEGIRWLRDFLTKFSSEGKTILITSHLMNELEQLATDFVFLHKGKIVEQVSRDQLKEQYLSLEQAYFTLNHAEN